MKTWLLLITAALLVSLSGCNRENVIKPVDIDALTGSWQLVEPSTYTVTLEIEPVVQNTMKIPEKILGLAGESSVNQYTALLTYESRTEPEISLISPISTTKRGGSAEAMQFEQTYYANMKAVNRYELTDKNRLKLFYQGGVLVYERTN